MGGILNLFGGKRWYLSLLGLTKQCLNMTVMVLLKCIYSQVPPLRATEYCNTKFTPQQLYYPHLTVFVIYNPSQNMKLWQSLKQVVFQHLLVYAMLFLGPHLLINLVYPNEHRLFSSVLVWLTSMSKLLSTSSDSRLHQLQ